VGGAAGSAATVVLALTLAACSSPSHPPVPRSGLHGAVSEFASKGCDAPPHPALTNQRDSMTVDGTTRDYLLTTPTGYTQPQPLVLDFHGFAEGDQTESLSTQFSPLAQRKRFVVAYPNGTGTPIAWDTSTRPSNPDLHFVTALLDHLEATECIDRSRVYATGLSQGAFMTSALACTMAGRFAAVAPVAGIQLPPTCHPSRPVPILAFHGTADPILHFNGGLGLGVLTNALQGKGTDHVKLPKAQLSGPGYPAHVAGWAAKDGCRQKPIDSKLTAHVVHRSYRCPPGVAVEFDIILGGGHSWPGSAFDRSIASVVGPTTSELNATATIWRFFERFRLGRVRPGA
jgi:polyhydroxybutyrate depolymerase